MGDVVKVYLIRHAPAVEMTNRTTDSQVHLSMEGRRIVRAVGTVLRNKEVSFEVMISSPYTRAIQTAELLAERVDYLSTIEANNAFIPEMPPRVALAEISTYNVDIAVVAHEPLLSALGALLVSRPSFPPFKRGQISCIEDGNPLWFIDPQFLEVKPLLIA
jgi:phosphohistidine phosphatase